MIADVFTVKARKLEPTLIVAALAEGVCPLCGNRLSTGYLLLHDRRRIQPNADAGGYCTACDVAAYTLVNSAGERRAFIRFRILADGVRFGRDTLGWQVLGKRCQGCEKRLDLSEPDLCERCDLDVSASMARHPSGRQR